MFKYTLLLCLIVGTLADSEIHIRNGDDQRLGKQFGFGGSGAQAGASSFGGGFGGGGFPGGFGGGFSGSQAGAGAGSFGGGFGR